MSNAQKPPERLPYSTHDLEQALNQIGYTIAYRPGNKSFFRIYNQHGNATYWEGNDNGIRLDRKECFGEGGSGGVYFEDHKTQEIEVLYSATGKADCVAIISNTADHSTFVSFYNHDA